MTIIEAVRSGKLFRRRGWIEYYAPLLEGDLHRFSLSDILATDWEVKKEKVKKTGWVELDFIHEFSPKCKGLSNCVQVTYEVEE